MSNYIYYLSNGARLSIDTSFIDDEDAIQSEDFSAVFGDFAETAQPRNETEVSSELIVGLAGTVH